MDVNVLCLKIKKTGTSLAVQCLRFHVPSAGGPGLIPGQGSRSLVRVLDATTKSLHATTKDPTHHTKTEDPTYQN